MKHRFVKNLLLQKIAPAQISQHGAVGENALVAAVFAVYGEIVARFVHAKDPAGLPDKLLAELFGKKIHSVDIGGGAVDDERIQAGIEIVFSDFEQMHQLLVDDICDAEDVIVIDAPGGAEHVVGGDEAAEKERVHLGKRNRDLAAVRRLQQNGMAVLRAILPHKLSPGFTAHHKRFALDEFVFAKINLNVGLWQNSGGFLLREHNVSGGVYHLLLFFAVHSAFGKPHRHAGREIRLVFGLCQIGGDKLIFRAMHIGKDPEAG